MGAKALIGGTIVGLGSLVASLLTPTVPSEVQLKSYIPTPGTYSFAVSQDGRGCELEERQEVYVNGRRLVAPYTLSKRFHKGSTNSTKKYTAPNADDWELRHEHMGYFTRNAVQLVFSDGTATKGGSTNSSSFSEVIMIAPDLALTAYHVVALADKYLDENKDVKQQYKHLLDVTRVDVLAEESGYSVGGQKATLVHYDPNRDLALLLLESPIPTVKGGVKFRGYPPTENENINIRTSNEVIPVNSITHGPDRLIYSTNELIEPGMSGSAITDGQGRIVGVLQTAHPGLGYVRPELRERVKEELNAA